MVKEKERFLHQFSSRQADSLQCQFPKMRLQLIQEDMYLYKIRTQEITVKL